MKRLVWGAFLFLFAAGASTSQLRACDWKTYAADPEEFVVIRDSDSTTLISSDDEFVTVVSYENSEVPSEWM